MSPWGLHLGTAGGGPVRAGERLRIVASGQPLLDWAGIELELRERRGEANEGA